MKNTYKNIVTLLLLNLIVLTGAAQYNNAFRFTITGNGYSDETIIRLVNGATENFDGSYDAWKLFSANPNVPSIYTQITAGQELSINSLPEFTEDKSITLYTNIPANGSYTITIEEIYALTPNYKTSLTDISSSSHARLLGDTALTFTFNAQQNSPTFTFNLSTPLVYSLLDETCYSMEDGSLTIQNSGNTNWDVQITDSYDNIVVNNNSNYSVKTYNSLLPGNYSVQVSSQGIMDEFNFFIASALNLVADFALNTDTIYLSEGGEVLISNNSQNAQNYSWDFGDGGSCTDLNPAYSYSVIGNYDITLTASNTNCISENIKQITVLQSPGITTSIDNTNTQNIKLASFGNGNYQLTTANYLNKQITVYDLKGSLIYEDISVEKSYNLSLTKNPFGIYLLKVIDGNGELFHEKLYR